MPKLRVFAQVLLSGWIAPVVTSFGTNPTSFSTNCNIHVSSLQPTIIRRKRNHYDSSQLSMQMSPFDSQAVALVLEEPSRQIPDTGAALLEHYATNVWTASNSVDNVIEDQDLVGGTLLALILAGGASFLQGRRNQNDFILSSQQPPPPPQSIGNTTSLDMEGNDVSRNASLLGSSNNAIFDDWAEMSRPENYVWYKKKTNNNNNNKQPGAKSANGFENPWVLVGLLLLFTPIFSFEFFLTVSRQIICSGFLSAETTEWCAPI